MQRHKLWLSLFLFLITLIFLHGGRYPEPRLFLLIAGGPLLLLTGSLSHRRGSVPLTISFLLIMALFGAIILWILPSAIFCFLACCVFLLYGLVYGLLLICNGIVFLLQKVPGTLFFLFASLALLGCFAASFALALALKDTCVWHMSPLGLLAYSLDMLPLLLDSSHTGRFNQWLNLPASLFVRSFFPYLLIKVRPPHSQKLSMHMQPDAEIFVHVADTKYGKLGHTDLCFDGTVISFGGYDASTQKLDGLFGEGTIFFAPDKEKYLNFCRSYSKKTIFSFGIRLTQDQKSQLRNKIDCLKAQTVPWSPDTNSPFDYASCLAQATGAQFYKFTKGQWKTYFILKNNCTRFCNELLRPLSIARTRGVITPGYYYEKLDRAWRQANRYVISKEILAYCDLEIPSRAYSHTQNNQQRTG